MKLRRIDPFLVHQVLLAMTIAGIFAPVYASPGVIESPAIDDTSCMNMIEVHKSENPRGGPPEGSAPNPSLAARRLLALVDLALANPDLVPRTDKEGLRLAADSVEPMNPFLNMSSNLGVRLATEAEPLLERITAEWPQIRKVLQVRVSAQDATAADVAKDSDTTRRVALEHQIKLEGYLRGSNQNVKYLGGLDQGVPHYLAWQAGKGGGGKSVIRKVSLAGIASEIVVFESSVHPNVFSFKDFIFVSFRRFIYVINIRTGSVRLTELQWGSSLNLPAEVAWFAQLGPDRLYAFMRSEFFEFDPLKADFGKGQLLMSPGELHTPRDPPQAMGNWVQFEGTEQRQFSGDGWYFDGSDVVDSRTGTSGVFVQSLTSAGAEALSLTRYHTMNGKIQKMVPGWKGGKAHLLPVASNSRLLLVSIPEKKNRKGAKNGAVEDLWIVDPDDLKISRVGLNPDGLEAASTDFHTGFNAEGDLVLTTLDRKSYVFTSWALDFEKADFADPIRFDFKDTVSSRSLTQENLAWLDKVVSSRANLILDHSGRKVLGIRSDEVIRVYDFETLQRNVPAARDSSN